MEIHESGEGKNASVQSVCVCLEVKMGLPFQHMGEGFLMKQKALCVSEGGKEILCCLLDSVRVCHQMYFA